MNGVAARPIVSEYPEDPRWILVGEGPGRTEVQLNRPFQGSAQLLEKMLAKIGRRRDEIMLTTATLCSAPMGATEQERDAAAKACKPRLQQELAQWPGMPVLTLGAIAARTLIPKAVLDAIDPPNVPKSKKRSQKERQKAEAKALIKALKADAKADKKRDDTIAKITKARLKALVEHQRGVLMADAMRSAPGAAYKLRKKPTRKWTDHEMERFLPKLAEKAAADALVQYNLELADVAMQLEHEAANPKPVKPPKHKAVKISDIMSTCFDIDVDDSGVLRPLIPTIHPGSLLKGGGATIGGTHTPDLAFINLYYDASKIDALSQGRDVRLKINVETELTDPERTGWLVRDAIDRAFVEGELSIDLETYVDDIERHHALMAYMARIRTIGLATNDKSVSVMWDHIPGWALSYLQLVLAHPNVTKTFHNGLIYDCTVLAANGFTVEGPLEDTLLGHHASFPGNAHRLQSVTAQFFATAPWKSDFRNNEETPEGLVKYCALDTGGTHALRPAMTLWIKRTKTERVYETDKKMARIASKMHLVGMPVDREKNSELLKTFSHNVKESRRAVEAIAEDPKLRDDIYHFLALQQAQKARKKDPTEWIQEDGTRVIDIEARYAYRMSELRNDSKWKWKVSANKHIAALLQALGVALIQTTASGQISTKKDILESLAHIPVVADILTFRENDKLNSTFIFQIFDRFDASGDCIQRGYADDDDRIHPIWSVHKITGRWASYEPVVSNVPKDKWKKLLAELVAVQTHGLLLPAPGGRFTLPDGGIARVNKDKSKSISKLVRPNLRAQIKAPKGRVFIGGDFAQIEYRIIALLSGDPHLCRTFESGKDIHIENARVIWPDFDQLDKETQKEVRERAKPLGYGAMYLAQVETLHRQLLKDGYNVKFADVAVAINKLLQAMAGVVRWQRETIALASQPPYEIRDVVLGRRRTWPLGQVESTEAVNFGVQSTAAAIMNQGLANHFQSLQRYKQADLIGQFHDAVIVEAWEDDADDIARDMKRDFEQEVEHHGYRIPFIFEPKIGTDWTQV